MKTEITAENDVVTDEMILNWESALQRDEWPTGWENVGKILLERLPTREEIENSKKPTTD